MNLFFQILEPRDPNNGNHNIQETGIGIESNMETGGNDILNISSSRYSNISSKMRSGILGPTAESALLFNTNACINFPNDNQFPGVCNDGTNVTNQAVSPNPSLQTSTWSQDVAKFRHQQELQRNLLIVKKQQAAAAAQTQQHGFIRQQNNLSHKRLMYQNQFSNAMTNNVIRSLDATKNEMRSVSGSTTDNGGNLSVNSGIICNQISSYNSKLPEYSESLEGIRRDEYLDPITGEFTTNDTIEDMHSEVQTETTDSPISNEVYNKNQVSNNMLTKDEMSRSNDNYGKIFNDYDNNFQYKIAPQTNFSSTGMYSQSNVATISSSVTSSFTSSTNNAIMNMTSF